MYFLYALLPITLFLMAVWAWLKPIVKVHGKEDGGRFFVMFLSCSLVLYVSYLIDKSGYLENLVEQYSFGVLDYIFVRWFIFPALLFFSAKIWDLYDKKNAIKAKEARSQKYS